VHGGKHAVSPARSLASPFGEEETEQDPSLLLLWEVRKVRGEGVRPGKVRKDSGSEFNGVRP
jgi:hypothetical protein